MKEFNDYNRFLDYNKTKKRSFGGFLKSIHGVNFKSIRKILLLNGFEKMKKEDIQQELFLLLKSQVKFFYNLEENKIFNNVEKKKRIKNYCGMRHILKLPVRGQRTHTNAKTPRINLKKEI